MLSSSVSGVTHILESLCLAQLVPLWYFSCLSSLNLLALLFSICFEITDPGPALATVLGHYNEHGLFTSGGFIHDDQPEAAAIIEEEDAEDLNNFIIPGGVCHNWVAVDVPTGFLNPLNIMIQRHLPILKSLYLRQRKMMLKGIPDEITRLLEHKRSSFSFISAENEKKEFDKKVKPRVFREGDLVLKKVLSFAPDSRGKWTPNYEGPYVVKRAFSGGALMLTTMDGEDFTRPVNSDAVKRYFA
ncbi:hypothetical protein KIW84_045368 [Lathyrus oleraceus]|uniref:Uncharacterized protein n=1 Tax=Pisum sativum TaxID=3888 RepID=A0A9D4XNN2_PEA|nr:hypothetical protein KIW84_045368 [Pisum sativum]